VTAARDSILFVCAATIVLDNRPVGFPVRYMPTLPDSFLHAYMPTLPLASTTSHPTNNIYPHCTTTAVQHNNAIIQSRTKCYFRRARLCGSCMLPFPVSGVPINTYYYIDQSQRILSATGGRTLLRGSCWYTVKPATSASHMSAASRAWGS
jgi:hypothetical protein